jgi:hypothetical protein
MSTIELNHAMIRVKPHTLILMIGVDRISLNKRAVETYSKLLAQSPYIKRISLEKAANWLLYPNISIRDVARAQISAVGIIIASVHATCTDSVPPLVILIDGIFTTYDIERLNELSQLINYTIQIIFIEPPNILNKAVNTSEKLIMGWNNRVYREIENTWSGTKVKVLSDDNLIINLNLVEWHRCQLQDRIWWIIGDVHGCYTELLQLFSEIGWKINNGLLDIPDNMGVIFVGDLVDRGSQVKEVIEFLAKNIAAGREIRLVSGNHDIFNLACIDDINIKEDVKHFDSVVLLRNDPILAGTFRALVNISTPFVQFISNNTDKQSFIVTHSICMKAFRGHLDDISISRQNYLPDLILCETDNDNYSDDPIIKKLRFAGYISDNYKDAVALFNEPLHYSGHLVVKKVYSNLNDPIVLLDTGCVFGGSLSAICHSDQKIISVPSINPINNSSNSKINVDEISNNDFSVIPLSDDDSDILFSLPDEYIESDGGNIQVIEPMHLSMMYSNCPPNAGKIECMQTALQHLFEIGINEVFAHSIPNGEITTVRVNAGELTTNVNDKDLIILHKSLKCIMETYQIDKMDVITIKESTPLFPDYAVEIQRLEKNLLENIINDKSELSIGKTLDLYEKAETLKSRSINLGRPGKYYSIDISSIVFSNGMIWNPSIKDKNWSSAAWRYKSLRRGGQSGSLSNSCVLPLDVNSITETANKISKMASDSREAFSILIQSNCSSSFIYKLHTPRGLMLEYGPLHSCNSEYKNAYKKWKTTSHF